jgi:hypothetical protein
MFVVHYTVENFFNTRRPAQIPSFAEYTDCGHILCWNLWEYCSYKQSVPNFMKGAMAVKRQGEEKEDEEEEEQEEEVV